MRLLIVDLERNWRGGQEQALLLLKGVRARGHEPEVLVREDAPLAKHAAAAELPVHTVSPSNARLGATLQMRRLFGRRSFDIVHVNEPHALLAAWMARAHRRAAMVIARRVAFPVPRNRISLIRYRAASRLVAVSRVVADDLLAAHLDPPGVDVVPDGVDLQPVISDVERRCARARWNLSSEERVLSFVASFTEEKGHTLLLEAFRRLRQQAPACKLLLAGDGPLRALIEREARDKGLSESVLFAGFVEDVRAIHAASDVFVFPALNEGAGSALLSAMAAGLPVVGLARGGVSEILDGNNGRLVKADADAISSAMLELLNDKTLAQRMACAARQTISARFSTDHMVENTLRVFERLTNHRSGSVALIPV